MAAFIEKEKFIRWLEKHHVFTRDAYLLKELVLDKLKRGEFDRGTI